jgi:DNA-binding beta-propeller fold protein YncE
MRLPNTKLPFKSKIALLASCLSILFPLASVASADLTFGTTGSGAGQMQNPKRIALDRASGNLYVADADNNRIDVFDSAGNFIRAFGWGVADGVSPELQTCSVTCFKGLSGSGAGQFKAPRAIAVDNDPTSPSYHDVYVLNQFRVQRFTPTGSFVFMLGGGVNKTTGGDICTAVSGDFCGGAEEGSENGEFPEGGGGGDLAVGSGGVLYVGSNVQLPPPAQNEYAVRIQKFEPSGAFIESVPLPITWSLSYLVVDSSGSIYASRTTEIAHKYDPTGTELYALDKGGTALTVDASDEVFVAQVAPRVGEGGSHRFIGQYDAAGNIVRRFGYGTITRPMEGIAAFSSAGGDVLVSQDTNQILYLSFPPPGPIVVPESVNAKPVRSAKATLNAEVNPEGKETKFHFDYVDQKGFEESGFSGPSVKHTPDAVLGSDFELHLASEVVVVVPETRYHFRLVVENEDGSQTIEGKEFETLEPIELGEAWATEVGTDAATIHAEANPLESPATGYFEYVEDAAYQQNGFAEASQAPNVVGGAGPLDFGAGTGPVTRSAALYPLKAGTTYHYRLKAENSFITITGPERTFTTFARVAPNTGCPNQGLRTAFSAALPDCRAYELVSPLDKNNGDVVALLEFTTSMPAAIYQSSTAGDRLTYGSNRSFGDAQSGAYTSQYLSSRGPDGWSTEAIAPMRTTPVMNGAALLDTEFKAFSPDLCSAWLRNQADPPLGAGAIEGFPNLYRDDLCGEAGYQALTTVEPPHVLPFPGTGEYSRLELQGLSAGGEEAVYVAPDNLTSEAPVNTTAKLQLYHRSSGGQLRFVCFLPNGSKMSTGDCTAGGYGDSLSGDGRGRFANVRGAISDDGSRVYWTADKGQGKIYLRLNAGQGQSKVSAGKCTEAEKACTLAVSETVSAEPARFWFAAADGSKAIFTIGEKEGVSSLYEFDAVQAKSTLIAKGVRGVLGAGDDLTDVYFASKEALGEGASSGEPNLYVYQAGEGGGIDFIATLASTDVASGSGAFAAVSSSPRFRRSRVSPDGRHAAFISLASLTGYDNTDAKSGKPDAEVYLYDADAKKLICASCNPSGARPVGRRQGIQNGEIGVAAQIPVWQNQLYPTRVLADDGSRLYFDSTDSLVAADTNGVQDVYQWEAPGSGDCKEESPTYSPLNQGCVSLISSGQSPRGSEFIDASPSGDDVFIATLSSLLPQDYGLVDIYDARVSGGYPPEPPTPAACEGEACQGPYEPPEDPTPASSAFEGAGNVVEGKTPGRCTKGKVRRKGRCVAKQQSKQSKRVKQRKAKRAKHDRRTGR